jgi:hypothetical protein
MSSHTKPPLRLSADVAYNQMQIKYHAEEKEQERLKIAQKEQLKREQQVALQALEQRKAQEIQQRPVPTLTSQEKKDVAAEIANKAVAFFSQLEKGKVGVLICCFSNKNGMIFEIRITNGRQGVKADREEVITLDEKQAEILSKRAALLGQATVGFRHCTVEVPVFLIGIEQDIAKCIEEEQKADMAAESLKTMGEQLQSGEALRGRTVTKKDQRSLFWQIIFSIFCFCIPMSRK